MDICLDNKPINHSNTFRETSDLVWYFLPTVVTVPPLGLPANTLVIRLLLGKPGICSTSEIFTLNLALFDMLFCFMVFAEYIHFLCHQTVEASYFLAWGLNQAGGPMLLCMLGLDSYMAVCHPLLFLRLKDPKVRLSLCLVVSAVTAACCVLVKAATPVKWKVMLALLCSAIVIISTCNILILKSLRQSGPSRREVHPVKKRAFKIVLTAFVLVNFHYLPRLTEHLLSQLCPGVFKPVSTITCGTYVALSLSSFFQPLSYLVRTNQLPRLRCPRGSAAKAETGNSKSSPAFLTWRRKCQG